MPEGYDTTSLAAGAREGLERFTRTYQNGKIADSIVKVNPEMLGQLGMSKEQFGSLAAEDKTSAITGALQAIGMKSQQANTAATQAQTAAQTADLQSQAQLRTQQMNANAQQQQEDQAIGEALKRYGMGPPQAAQQGPIAPGQDAIQSVMPSAGDRFNYAIQTPGLGGRSVPKFLDALTKMQAAGKQKGMAAGSQMVLPDGTILTGKGEQNEPDLRPPPKGLGIGEIQKDDEGNMWIGKGAGIPPEVKLASDIKTAKAQGDTGRGRSVFMQAAPELGNQLDKLEAVIIKNNGNYAGTTWDPASVAALGQTPFQIAENYNKVVDPHSVNRPEKLEQDMIHLLPMGAGTRMDVTLNAIKSLREELSRRVQNFQSVEKELPPNLPASLNNMLLGRVPGVTIHPDTKFDNEAQARAAGAKTGDIILMRDPASGNYRRAKLT